MAENEIEKVEPAELPLASADSQPPLVVDLPDGQKLVVGNLDSGTVIEVATWRGTGRPDSRTNRIMLGISANEEKQKAIPGQVVTGLNHANIYGNNPYPILKNDTESKSERKFIRKAFKYLVLPAVVIAIFVSGFILIGLKVVHPDSGASTALGKADTALIIVKKEKTFEPADKVVAQTNISQIGLTVGTVVAIGQDNYLISNDRGNFQIGIKSIKGRTIAVFPYLGYFAKLIK